MDLDIDPLADVFGSTPPPDVDTPSKHQQEPWSSHPSDFQRLQEQHRTAGYREGLAYAKAASIQAGFDEGFGLGATIGLEVGRILGILEGIASALSLSGAADSGQATEANSLASLAREELSLKGVFAETYWSSDGTWKYPVGAPESSEAGEVLFVDVAKAHPLVRKWTQVCDDESRRWRVSDWASRELRDTEGQEEPAEDPETTSPRRVPAPSKKPLEW